MHLSRESKIICGVLLILVPTIVYGGITLLGIVTQGSAGMSPGDLSLSETQRALWRAGHAHAGVFVILAILLQLLVDQATLSKSFKWLARLGAPIASVLVPAGSLSVISQALLGRVRQLPDTIKHLLLFEANK